MGCGAVEILDEVVLPLDVRVGHADAADIPEIGPPSPMRVERMAGDGVVEPLLCDREGVRAVGGAGDRDGDPVLLLLECHDVFQGVAFRGSLQHPGIVAVATGFGGRVSEFFDGGRGDEAGFRHGAAKSKKATGRVASKQA